MSAPSDRVYLSVCSRLSGRTSLRSAAGMLLYAVLITAAGCSRSDTPQGAGTDTGSAETRPETSDPQTQPSDIIVAGEAKPVGSFLFRDQNGEEFGQDQIQNSVTVVCFVFTRCPGTCPQQSAAMKQLQDRLKASGTEGVRLLTISVDPEFDTPDVLKDYGTSLEADFDMWAFLTGDREAIWNFSRNNLGMAVAENPEDPLIPIAHESKFVLFDRAQRIRGYFDSQSTEGIEQLWSAIDEVLPDFVPDAAQLTDLPESAQHMAQPPGILDDRWLADVGALEAATMKELGLAPGFQFEDCVEELGVTFRPQIVDDQRHRLLVNHYDHGNGVSVADVDGDGVADIYFTSQVGPNELWRGTPQGGFEKVADSGAEREDRISVAASFADTDNDGDPDLFVTSIRAENSFFENVDGTFVDRTKSSGLAYTGHSSKGTFFDYDKDGLLDLYVCNVGRFTTEEKRQVRTDAANSQPSVQLDYFVGRPDAFSGHLAPELSECSRLYRNLGNNQFEDVTEQFGLQDDASWSGDAVAFDANNDGWPDLYVCNMQGHDTLYINEQGDRFTDRTDEFFQATPWGTMGVTVADFDNNGKFDVFLTDMHSDMSVDVGPDREKQKADITWPEEFLRSEGRSIYGNAFFQQAEDGTFKEVSDALHAENYWPWGLSSGDIDADGFADAFLTSSMCFPYRYSTNSLLLNAGGQRFYDAHFATQIEPRPRDQQIAPWFSLNFDAQDADNRLRKSRKGEWVVWSATGSRSSVIYDFDNDGDLDIVTNEFNTRPQFLRSNRQQSEIRFLKVDVQGTGSNRDALGAVVRVHTTGQRQSQVKTGASGYLGQSDLPLYFGLGTAETVDRIEVTWPTGTTQVVDGPIDTNQRLQIVEDQ
ncbi:MAG: FG-GAP-like repeat-containing protein [Planctomycetaceae bacterium]|nr:FG-GAP-like repeat-containing protein [Planctomycetaceae bacterium]